MPYAWRLCQCIRTWKDTGNTGQLLNAVKYSTAFPVIILSAVNFQVTEESWNQFWKPLWLFAAFLNSAYSFYWDTERDWDIQYFSSASGIVFQCLSCLLGALQAFCVSGCCINVLAYCRSEVAGTEEATSQRQVAVLARILHIPHDNKSWASAGLDVQTFSAFETEPVDSPDLHPV